MPELSLVSTAAAAATASPNPEVDATLLSHIPLFAKLSKEDLAALAGLLKRKAVAPGTPLMFIGDGGSEFYVVQIGRVEVSQPDESGKEVRLAELGPGQFFGEISLLDGGPRTATVRALNEVIVLSLERAAFVDFLMKHPAAAVHILTVLGHRQRDLLEKLRGIRNVNEAIGGEQTRLEWLLSKVAGVFASEKFLIGNLVVIVAWIVVHTILYTRAGKPIDFLDAPPTYFWLGFMITVEAILVSIFVLNSQRRQAERDRVRADLEYQVNIKAHMEVMELHRKVDKLREEMRGGGQAASAGEVQS